MIYTFIADRCQDLPVVTCCRVMKVSTSGFYEARRRGESRRLQADRALIVKIREIHGRSRGTYGAPRIHAELADDYGVRCGRKRVARLMRDAGICGIYRRRSHRKPVGGVSFLPDLVNRQFHPSGPNELWVTDITQHRTREGWVYCAAVLDAWSRRIVGWSIADHLRTELVVDAITMATWRRPEAANTILHSDHGTQFTSWVFGKKLRDAGLLGSMGSIGDAYDNAMIESFWGSMQLELLDRQKWTSRQQLANAIFDWIERFYNPTRRHSQLGYKSPINYEQQALTA